MLDMHVPAYVDCGPDTRLCGLVTVCGGKLGGRADAGAAGTEAPARCRSVWRSEAERGGEAENPH